MARMDAPWSAYSRFLPLTPAGRARKQPRGRGCSSDGRALQSHCRGQGFESPQLHQPVRPDGVGFP